MKEIIVEGYDLSMQNFKGMTPAFECIGQIKYKWIYGEETKSLFKLNQSLLNKNYEKFIYKPNIDIFYI